MAFREVPRVLLRRCLFLHGITHLLSPVRYSPDFLHNVSVANAQATTTVGDGKLRGQKIAGTGISSARGDDRMDGIRFPTLALRGHEDEVSPSFIVPQHGIATDDGIVRITKQEHRLRQRSGEYVDSDTQLVPSAPSYVVRDEITSPPTLAVDGSDSHHDAGDLVPRLSAHSLLIVEDDEERWHNEGKTLSDVLHLESAEFDLARTLKTSGSELVMHTDVDGDGEIEGVTGLVGLEGAGRSVTGGQVGEGGGRQLLDEQPQGRQGRRHQQRRQRRLRRRLRSGSIEKGGNMGIESVGAENSYNNDRHLLAETVSSGINSTKLQTKDIGKVDSTEKVEKSTRGTIARDEYDRGNTAGEADGLASGGSPGLGMVRFTLDGKAEGFMAADVMRTYLNELVDASAAATHEQKCNIAFVKTHKTASTTLATILFRYGKRHGLEVANFEGHHSSIALPEAVRQIQTSGRRVDVMHYHHAWDGFYGGEWNQARSAYQKIMRDPTAVNLVTVMREPVAHYLSYYYYFLQPQIGISIVDYFHAASKPNHDTPWHGSRVLHNPICAEFGIRNVEQLEEFLNKDIGGFAMILLTEQFEESLAIFMRMFNWRPVDMTYRRVIETRAGNSRYDGKMLTDVPKARDLPPQVLQEIHRQTKLDQALYKAAVRAYRQYKLKYGENLDLDVQRIRTAQSAVHGYLNYDADSLAHSWYEGDVKLFENPSPMQPF